MDMTAVFEGLAANADTIEGLRCHAFHPDSIVPPTLYVVEAEIQYDRAFARGMDDYTVTCRVLTSRGSDRAGQQALQAYMSGTGNRSIKAALETDKTLGGACHDLQVMRATGMGLYDHNGTNYYGADWFVRVIGSGA